MYAVNETTFDKIELPEILYKYRNWENSEHKRILTDCEIYFAKPKEMDEHHECAFDFDYNSITRKDVYQFLWREGILPYEVRKTHDAIAFFNHENRLISDSNFKKEFNEKLGIFCASEKWNNENLWKSFANAGNGFCVGIDTRIMLENHTILGGGGKVTYYADNLTTKLKALNYYAEKSSRFDLMNIIMSLPKKWELEDEYRLYKFDIENRKVKINPKSIKEVILGEFICKENEQEIIAIVKKKFPDVKIYKVKYHYDFEYYYKASI